MANRSKAIGSEWELRLLRHFREAGLDAERLNLSGKEDEGDLVLKVGHPVIIQAKATKAVQLWRVDDAHQQAEMYAHHRALFYQPESYLILKRRNHATEKAYVVQTLDQFVKGLPS